ncbi:MAG: peptidase M13, partial [Actinomycetaceae bacterium]|nr:peptidase M13 [Actinomycetaceae bacterium]
PDEAYYREPQHAEVLAAYKAFVPKMLALVFGLSADDAAAQAAAIVDVETAIAAHHMNVVDTRDLDKVNNPMEWREFVASAPGFDWNGAMAAAGLTEEKLENVLVLNPDALSGGARLWAELPLDTWKAYTRWRIAVAYSKYLTEEIDAASFDFFGRVLTGAQEQKERWKRGVQLVNGALGEAVGKLYVERHFPPEYKAKMEQLVADLLQAYRESITQLDWMGEETKKKALEKVDSFDLKIGYPEKWQDYSAMAIGDDLVENVRQATRYEFNRDIAKLGAPVDRSEWLMSPQTVNAYYKPTWNEIVFPAAILQFPFFDPNRDDALNYGGIGAVIGHEIGHGFDDQGSKYAADGSLQNWWTDEDRAEFEKRTSALVAQYDAYVPGEFGPDSPHHVQGALTLG